MAPLSKGTSPAALTAGHFVKMVHNGIEYGVMAAYAEGLGVLGDANIGKQEHAADAETTPLMGDPLVPKGLDGGLREREASPMPRQARLDAPGTLHQVMVRGIERTQIFRDDTDRAVFLVRLAPLAALRSGHRTQAISWAQSLLYQLAIRHLRYPGRRWPVSWTSRPRPRTGRPGPRPTPA